MRRWPSTGVRGIRSLRTPRLAAASVGQTFSCERSVGGRNTCRPPLDFTLLKCSHIYFSLETYFVSRNGTEPRAPAEQTP